MRKIFFLTIILSLIIFPVFVFAQDCPFDEVNCEGACGAYTDADRDTYCDYGEVIPENSKVLQNDVMYEDLITGQELKIKRVEEVADIYSIDADLFAGALSKFYGVKIRPKDHFQLLHDNYGLEPSVVKDIASQIALSGYSEKITEVRKFENKYRLISISLFLVVLYGFTYVLYKKNIIKRINHFRFWNILLLFTFLGVGLSGIFLVLRINYGININWPFNILHFHVEIGIAMTLISVFHTLWHWKYFRNIFKRK